MQHEHVSKEELIKQYREEALTDAVRKLVAQDGIAGVTVEHVADLAGVSKGTIYLYFKNKEELLRATIANTIDRLIMSVREAIANQPDYAGKLEALVKTHLLHLDENFAFFRDMMTAPEIRPKPGCAHSDDVVMRHLTYMKVIADIVAIGRDEGVVRDDIDADETAFFLLHLMQAAGIRRILGLSNEPLASSRGIERLLQFFQHGVAKL